MKEHDAWQGNKPEKLTPYDTLSLARLYHRYLTSPNSASNSNRLWKTFLIQTLTLDMYNNNSLNSLNFRFWPGKMAQHMGMLSLKA